MKNILLISCFITFPVASLMAQPLQNELAELTKNLDALARSFGPQRIVEEPIVGLPAEIQLNILKSFIPNKLTDATANDIIKIIIKAINFATSNTSRADFPSMLFEIAEALKKAHPKEETLFKAFMDALDKNAKNVLIVLTLIDKNLLTKILGDRTLLMLNSEFLTDIPGLLKQQGERLKTLLAVMDTLKDNLNLNAIMNTHTDDYLHLRGATALLLAIESGHYAAAQQLLQKAFEWGILNETLEATDIKGDNAYRMAQKSNDPRFKKLIHEYYEKIGRHYNV